MNQKKAYLKHTLFCVLFFYYGIALFATEFKMTDSCLKAQNCIYQFQFDEADRILNNEKILNPDNIAVHWLIDYSLFFKIFSSEDKNTYNLNLKKIKLNLAEVEAKKFNNAWHKTIIAEIYFHQGLIKLRFNDFYNAAFDIKKSFTLLKENQKSFPAFLPDNKNYGTLLCLFSTIPSKYNFFANLIGIKGDMQTGLEQLEKYMNANVYYGENILLKKETAFYYAQIQHHILKNTKKGFELVMLNSKNHGNSLFENYMRSVFLHYCGKTDDVIQVISNFSGNNTYPFHYSNYLLGLSKLRKLDKDAEINFISYIKHFKGENLIKSSYRYLARAAILKNNEQEANRYYKLVLSKGRTDSDEDKIAEGEAKQALNGGMYRSNILKIRMLFDGKYYEQTETEIKKIDVNQLTISKEWLEVNYIQARINEDQKKVDAAIAIYQKIIVKGKDEPYYFAAYSALNLGYIYEVRKENISAEKYYLMALNEFKNNKEYPNSIEIKAKQGLKRLQ